MKKNIQKTLLFTLSFLLLFSIFPSALGQSAALPPERLANLTHNIKNTGIMLPAQFSPYTETYLLTVANWVSNVRFTPTASTNSCIITVNGQGVASGQQSHIIKMTDEPQIATINVKAVDGAGNVTGETTYTIFLQRRPSQRRNQVSAGYITSLTRKENGTITIDADLVTLSYQPGSNSSTYTNRTVDSFKYTTSEHCLFYYGTTMSPVRAYSADEFVANFNSGIVYNFIYLEDEIIAVMPY